MSAMQVAGAHLEVGGVKSGWGPSGVGASGPRTAEKDSCIHCSSSSKGCGPTTTAVALSVPTSSGGVSTQHCCHCLSGTATKYVVAGSVDDFRVDGRVRGKLGSHGTSNYGSYISDEPANGKRSSAENRP